MELKEYLLQNFKKELVDEVLLAKKYYRLIGNSKTGKGKFKDINIDLIKNLYINYKFPMYKIAMLCGVSDVMIRKYLIGENVTMNGHRCGSNSFNSYFEKIDSFDKAYFLGLMFADGNVRECNRGGGRFVTSIMLTESDSYILERFSNYANFNTKLILSHKDDEKPRKGIIINSKKIYDDLTDKGIIPRKSKLGLNFIPDLDDTLISHFIRGYYDGDGIAKSQGYIGFCGDIKIISYIKDYLVKNLNVFNCKITFNKWNNIYYIQWGKLGDVEKIFRFLYKDCNDLFLERKYTKINNRLCIQ